MFGLFKKKSGGITVTDKVVIELTAKYKQLLNTWQADKTQVFVCWFEESLDEATAYMQAAGAPDFPLMLAREFRNARIAGKPVIFTEHYPLRSKEEELWQAAGLQQVTVYAALREPLFSRFGGDKIIQVMLQLGMKEDELIEHSMISSSIKKAQEKIEKQITTENTARSQESWINSNYSQ